MSYRSRIHEPSQSSFRGLFNRHKQNARKRQLDWSLTFEQFLTLVAKPCHWCGVEPFERYNVAVSKNGYTQRPNPTEQTESGWVLYNGLDRIDNSLGYMLVNVVPSCKWCNFARNERTVEEFETWVLRIGNFHGTLLSEVTNGL